MKRNRHIIRGVITLWLIILACDHAVSQETEMESAIEKLITDFFSAMKAKDIRVIQESFHTDAVMHTTQTDGNFGTLGHTKVADFLARVSGSTAVLDERIISMRISIDGNMAHAWTPYKFFIDDTFSHCGVNSFQFINTATGWKIVHIIDTRHKSGCD